MQKEDIKVKHKKALIGTAIVLAFFLLGTVIFYFMTKEKRVTDITVDGSKIEFDVNREFYLYEDEPLADNDMEPLKEVRVTLKGKADSETGEFDGEASIEGLALGGNDQSYAFYLGDLDEDSYYELCCYGNNLSGKTPVDGAIYWYVIHISKDLKQIKIHAFSINETDVNGAVLSYYIMNNGY